MPERNVALIEAGMQHIEDFPELHDQSGWAAETPCGTVACFAGRVCLLAGQQMQFDWGWIGATVLAPSGETVSVRSTAIELLGLTSDEADTLFFGSNTPEMLRHMVKDLVNGDELRPWKDYYTEASA